MNTLIIIPSRMNSSRLPGKPLKKILNKTMIEHCFLRAKMALGKENVYIASCDKIIKEEIKRFGGNYIATSRTHKRASTRTAEALVKIEKKLKKKIDIIIMYQGDEPFIKPLDFIDMISIFKKQKKTKIANLVFKTNLKKIINNKNYVKVVGNKKMEALYFSREPIPSSWLKKDDHYSLIQTGIIAFKRESLILFNKTKETFLETMESIDMNRLLELSQSIQLVISKNFYLSIDTKTELLQAKKIMEKDEIYISYR